MSEDDWDGAFAAPVKRVRARPSRIGEYAPEAERVLTVACIDGVAAAVRVPPSRERLVVTALTDTPLDGATRSAIAPCRCPRRQHVLDLDKLAAVVAEMPREAGRKTPRVSVADVARTNYM